MAGPMNRRKRNPPNRDWWRRQLPKDIRARILLVALATLLPLLLLVVGSAFVRLFTVGSNAQRQNQQAARAVATSFDRYVQDIRHQQVVIGTAIGTRGAPNWGWTNRLLATAVNQNPSLRNMSWLSPQGRILASSAPVTVGTNLSGSDPIRQLLAGQPWIVSDLMPTGPISQTLSMVLATAIRGSTGQLLGILAAEVDPDNLSNVLLRDQRPDDGAYAIFDRQGNLVASNPPRQGTGEERAAWRKTDPVLRRAIRAHNETSGVVNPATFDAAMYAVYTPIAETGYIAGALLPRANARGPVWRGVLWNLLLSWLVTGLVILLAYRVSSTIVDPAQTLQANVERLRRKESVQPLDEVAPTEIRELQTATTAMTALLLQRIDTCETDRDRLYAMIESMPAGVRYVNADGEVQLANPIARDILGEDALGIASTPRGRYTLQRTDGSPLPLAEIPLIYALHEGQARRNMELIIRYENGEGILALVSASPVTDAQGTPTGVVEVVVPVISDVVALQGISASTNLEQQLATVRTQLQTLLEILPVGVFILDAQGRITSANAESARLWGGVIPEINALADFRFFHGWWTRTNEPLRPEDWPPVRALTKNETVLNDPITLNRFDGLRGNVRTSAAPLRNPQGAITGAIWVIQDPISTK